jgi:hypothetical protein
MLYIRNIIPADAPTLIHEPRGLSGGGDANFVVKEFSEVVRAVRLPKMCRLAVASAGSGAYSPAVV